MPSVTDFNSAFPNSTKVYIDGAHGVRVPMREIALSDGEPSLRVYDTSGPHSHDVNNGLPKLRLDWVLQRNDVEHYTESPSLPVPQSPLIPDSLTNQPLRAKPRARPTQMHYARRGE